MWLFGLVYIIWWLFSQSSFEDSVDKEDLGQFFLVDLFFLIFFVDLDCLTDRFMYSKLFNVIHTMNI